jgi:signal peptidase I
MFMRAEMPLARPEVVAGEQPLLPVQNRERSSPSLWVKGRRFLAVALLAVASYLFISQFLLQSVRVVGVSMSPTLSDSQHYILNRWIYHVRSPHRMDIVVLRDPSDNGFSVKRVIALPGETVYLKEGGVYVNGRKLDEPYLLPGMPTYSLLTLKEQLFRCGQDQFLLLGDNRQNSIDSRAYGPVPRGNILGMVIH